MGHFRFHRSIGNKFVRLNVSKTGLSLTSGVPGAHLNVPLAGRKRKAMSTFSLPGTGLSYRQSIGSSYTVPTEVWIVVLFIVVYLIFGVF
jgi:hypothetical protein